MTTFNNTASDMMINTQSYSNWGTLFRLIRRAHIIRQTIVNNPYTRPDPNLLKEWHEANKSISMIILSWKNKIDKNCSWYG